MRLHRLDVVDAAARAPTHLVRETRSFRDGVVPTQEPSDEMATRLAKLAAGVDEAAERRAAKRLECRRVRDRAVWPTRVRDSDADRECRTVLKQLRKLAVKKHSFYFEKMVPFSV